MTHRTKIVCTMGPAVDAPEMIVQLIRAGMNGARLNCSHGTHAEHQQRVDRLKSVRREMGVPLAIMLDIKGPEVRLGTLIADCQVQEQQRLQLVEQQSYQEQPQGKLPLRPYSVASHLHSGDRVLIDDGYLSATVEREPNGIFIRFLNPGVVKSHKSLNIPGAQLSLPAVTEKDRQDLLFAIDNQLEWIAASFIRNAEHVLEIKRFLAEHGGQQIMVAAKIENQEGVDNFDQILEVCDGIMVARGDLGVEVPLACVPRLQKMMIRKAYLAGKPVITATQMLESMIHNPRPTRAEVSDVANAIYDSSSAVMLSGETAIGNYPVETVQMMHSIIEEAEKDFDYRRFFDSNSDTNCIDMTSSIALAAVKTAFSSHAKAIVCFTRTGRTARLISRHRPSMRIIAGTSEERVFHQLALSWGVDPVLIRPCPTLEEGFEEVTKWGRARGWLQDADLLLVSAGTPFGVTGSTNVIMLKSLGKVLVR